MSDLDVAWVLLCTLLVLLMQAGFTCLEAGLVRHKNSINVALKNIVDFGISTLLFGLIGYGVMFGPSHFGFIGLPSLDLIDASGELVLVILFQAMFAGTAVTLISGAVAERMTFKGYVQLAIVTAVLLYPITGHWAWNDGGWLKTLGFHDFAGSAVVHAVGGAVALVAIWKLGPRLGRYDGDGGIEPSNMPMAALGTFILLFGWFGFNGGSGGGFDDNVPNIIAATALAAAAGCVTALVVSQSRGDLTTPDRPLNGLLGGLVAVTAGADMVSPIGAIVLGGVGGFIAAEGGMLLDRLKLDDAVGAVPVHLFAGVWGTVGLALVAPAEALPDGLSRAGFLGAQTLGIVAIVGFTLIAAGAVVWLLDRLAPLRVDPDSERIGLNVAEHGARTGMLDLLAQLSYQAEHGDFGRAVVAEPETEAYQAAAFYNRVRERFLDEARSRDAAVAELTHLANHDPMTDLLNRRAFFTLGAREVATAHRHRRPMAAMLIDIDLFKAINDSHGHAAGDMALVEVAAVLSATARETDLVARLGGEEFVLLLPSSDMSGAVLLAERVRQNVRERVVRYDGQLIDVTVSIGVGRLHDTDTLDDLLKRADIALYAAKAGGRDRVVTETVL